jgi:uncharacterized protein YecE (DUF72 family)
MKRITSSERTGTLPLFPEADSERSAAMIGTSGFSYADWKGSFYPQKLPAREWLRYYATRFDAVEINLTFYRPPTASTLRKWKEAVPPRFAFVLKASQVITHTKRLVHCGEDFERLVEEYSPLGSQLACVLFQLPPSMSIDEEWLARFLRLAGSKLAEAPIRPRLAVEFRHRSWNTGGVLSRLADYGWAMVLHDMERAGGWRIADGRLEAGTLVLTREELFARSVPFLYLRFHGTTGRYAGEYGAERLEPWAALVRSALERQLPVHAYFNNTMAGAAARDASRFEEMVRNRT